MYGWLKVAIGIFYRVLATRDNWESLLTLTPQAREDLSWWLTALRGWNGAPLINRTIDVQIETDASGKGSGGVLLDKEVAGLWSRAVRYEHSNYKELFAVHMTLRSFITLIENKRIQVLSDNVTTMAYISRLDEPREKLTNLMSTVWSFAHNHGLELTAKHLGGSKNIHADRLSWRVSPYEWKLNHEVFSYIDRLWGQFTINRFASSLNKQLPLYNSFLWDPDSEAVDAFTQQNWKQENNWVNAPFWLIPKILDLICTQEVDATIIVWCTGT